MMYLICRKSAVKSTYNINRNSNTVKFTIIMIMQEFSFLSTLSLGDLYYRLLYIAVILFLSDVRARDPENTYIVIILSS